MELSDYRTQIDRIDAELLRLFAERMQTAAGIAAYKKEHALPVLDTGREREKLAGIVKAAPEDLQEEAVSLFRLLFSLSRGYQRSLLGSSSTLPEILAGRRHDVAVVPTSAAVAQAWRAYSQACDKPFLHPSVLFCATFDKVRRH
ncbi:MAG: chorismate mutase [Oscillospiraceae bacterium]